MTPAVAPFAFVLLLFLFGCSFNRQVHGDDEGFEILRMETFAHTTVCNISKVPSKNALRIVHRYGPCSPSNDGSPDDEQILGRDTLRIAYLQNLIGLVKATGGNTSMDGLQQSLQQRARFPVHSHSFAGSRVGGLSYVVTIGIGTPPRSQTVEFDTGSNVCWIQCMPCRSCYSQQDPIFDPATSHSYRNITCNDPGCIGLPPEDRNCVDNNCAYHVRYGDSSSTTGFLALDRLMIGEANFVIPNFMFGCGHDNKMTSTQAAGLLGLGRGLHSLVIQASSKLGKVFSYCLPSANGYTGYLIIGQNTAPQPSYTPMLTGPRDYTGLYFVDLQGISVGARRLSIPPTVLRGIGTIIDSGTTFSQIPTVAYRALRDAFRSAMSQYQLAAPVGELDTCYNFRHVPSPRYPGITLHFSGADHLLTAAQTFYVLNDTSTCLAFSAAPTGELGIIGNLQQRGMEVIYDIGARRIGFSRGTNCH